MKFLITFSFGLLLMLTFSNENDSNTSYRIKYISKVDFKENKSDTLTEKQKKFEAFYRFMAKGDSGQTMILDYSKNKSIFYWKKKLNEDSSPTRLYKGEMYIDYERGIIKNQKESLGGSYIVTDSIPKYEWTLYPEEKIINGYNCKKATTFYYSINQKGKTKIGIEVWYTNKIPLSIGPMDYSGLPGLIIRSQSGKMIYEMESIKEINDIDIKEPKKGKVVTAQEYLKIGEKVSKAMFNR